MPIVNDVGPQGNLGGPSALAADVTIPGVTVSGVTVSGVTGSGGTVSGVTIPDVPISDVTISGPVPITQVSGPQSNKCSLYVPLFACDCQARPPRYELVRCVRDKPSSGFAPATTTKNTYSRSHQAAASYDLQQSNTI